MNKNNVALSRKFMCYFSVVRATLCYGCQVWGLWESDYINGVLRFFIKRIFQLAYNTPNYALYLETGLEKEYVFTLNMHLGYIMHALTLPPNRLPNKMAQIIISKDIYWCREWKMLARKHGINLLIDTRNIEETRSQMLSVVEAVRRGSRQEVVQAALSARRHTTYAALDYDLGDKHYLTDNIPDIVRRWIFKARTETIHLNFKPWLVGKNYYCSLCNLQENEDIFHFVARCPVLAFIRKRWLSKITLTRTEFIDYLNGKDWRSLANYLKNAWFYRWNLVLEFNF